MLKSEEEAFKYAVSSCTGIEVLESEVSMLGKTMIGTYYRVKAESPLDMFILGRNFGNGMFI